MIRILLALSLLGCGKTDDCQRLLDKMWPVLSEMGKQAGKSGDLAAQKGKFLEECRKGDRMKKDPMTKCVLDAKDEAAVRECMTRAFTDFSSKSKSTEAKIQLDKIGKRASVYFVEKGEYPRGKAATLPAKPCCEGPDRKCPAVPAAQWAADPVWAALEFTVEESARFQYAYESADGKTFKATAVGDLDCDGVAITYTLDGTIEGGGPATRITEPTGAD